MSFLRVLDGWKTYVVSYATILYAAFELYTGALSSQAGTGMILGALGGASMRHAVSKMRKR